MRFREAIPSDIPGMQVVRHLVKENVLSDPALVKDIDYIEYLTSRGKGWVCEVDNRIVGFAIADLKEHNIWALFIDPVFEGKGIGYRLHQLMMDWYFNNSIETVWLSTAPATRGYQFYRNRGWKEKGTYGKGEVLFKMNYNDWQLNQDK